jgi:DNA-binding protein Fis
MADWNQKKAAVLLRVNPSTLNEKLKRLNIRMPSAAMPPKDS